ncbi:MAG: ABC transporter substrate-binding protein [Firmicutes bacterium HGW-Firmicutes-11]|jgi:NitT/TauT family transport system substrate-binding protein|nr:MAG: ABC transporter substrate-binding protein [Firmicutes bacterium HGW-Firmicutes-11]
MKKKANIAAIIMLLLAATLAAGCSSIDVAPSTSMDLNIGLMPAVDAAPILLAQEKGYFDDLGLAVALEIFTNPQNRQSALQTFSIDGAMTDLIAVATNVDGGFDIKATTMTNGVFPVLSKPGSKDLESIKVGMMEVSVTNYLIDKWLGNQYKIEKVFITEIPARLAAIGSGDLDMGLFPEPVASMGELNGLEKTLYELEDGNCPDVMVFTAKALEEKGEAIRLFHEAYNKAVEDINNDPAEALDILMKKIPNLSPEVRDLIVLPVYTKASLPDKAYIEEIIQWTSAVVKKDLAVDADALVERKYVGQ